MTVDEIKSMQKDYGFDNMQSMIEAGTVWHMEGSMGRSAMVLLESGACFLPTEPHMDYWGNVVPSRDALEDGTKGTLGNAIRFWGEVQDGTTIIDFPDPYIRDEVLAEYRGHDYGDDES